MSRRILEFLRLEDRLTPATATWDGGGADNHWSTAANWVGDVAPNPGDDLVFPAGAAQRANVNDLTADTSFRVLNVNDTGYQISGNAVQISTAVTANIAGGGLSELGLPIDGSGGISNIGFGALVLSGDNSYTGQTLVSAGSIRVQSDHALGSTVGDTVVGFDSSLDFLGSSQNAEPITLGGQSGLNSGINVSNGNVILTGPITLSTDQGGRIAVVANGSLSIQGNVTGTEFSVLYLYGTPIRFESTSTIDVAILAQFEGATIFNGHATRGNVQLSSSLPFPPGIFGGTGTVGSIFADLNSVLSPGDGGVGTLTTGDLTATNGSVNLDLAPAGIDQLAVHGAVNFHSYPEAPGATLQITPAPGFTIPPDATYRIIDNDGTDPVVGTFHNLPQGAVAITIGGVPLFINYHGGDGNDVELSTVRHVPMPAYSVGAGIGGTPVVNVYDQFGGLLRSFLAYDGKFQGGVHVATADINGDGVNDTITGPGSGGGPDIRVWDGVTGAMIREFNAYDPAFTGGVFVAAGDVNGDGTPDIVTGAGAGGGPHVKVFDGKTGQVLLQFMAYDVAFRGGVSVAAGDINSDGKADIVTGAGPGGGPHVRVFDGATGNGMTSFFAYDLAFRGGVNVATIPGLLGGVAIVTAPGAGGGPDVRVFLSRGFGEGPRFLAYDPNFTGGVTLGVAPIGPSGTYAILTGPGPGGGPHVKAFLPAHVGPPTVLQSFLAFDPTFLGGVFVG
jgi:autotransporter-associated beta strand protein